jgi:hypothetical protein
VSSEPHSDEISSMLSLILERKGVLANVGEKVAMLHDKTCEGLGILGLGQLGQRS